MNPNDILSIPIPMPRPTLFLIDGSSQMYRAYHAFRGRGLSNQEGHTTHAVYVFVTMLRKLMNDHQPRYIAASFDLAGPTFRDALVADYKANRAAMPDDLAEQINWVHEACEAMGVPIVTAPGYEADDVIGTIATRAAESGFEVAIVSIDKDFFQLVARRHPCLRPARRRRLVRRGGGGREVRRRSDAGRRCARARRRHERQRGGRAGRRQEGRHRPDQRLRQPRRAPREGRRAATEEVPRDAGGASRRRASQP